jgi:hypothetical protein
MRYEYAKWLVAFTEEHGVGLGAGELAEVEEAEFRLRGVAIAARSDVPAVESNVVPDKSVMPWEPDVLGPVVHELLPIFDRGRHEPGDGK